MIATVWLALSGLLYSLQLQTGSFPKPLSASEEEHYLELAAQGDLEARNILIERNLRLVAHIMKKYYAQMSDQEDLISIGTIGLIKGITTFDKSKGARLATYAARCVENAILSPMRFGADPKTRQVRKKCLPGIFVRENHRPRVCRWFQKAFAMPSSAAAESLPLMREVDSP